MLISPTITDLTPNNNEVSCIRSRRNGGRGCQPIVLYLRRSLREAAKFYLAIYRLVEGFYLRLLRQQEAQINAGRVPQPASPQWRQNQFCFHERIKVLS